MSDMPDQNKDGATLVLEALMLNDIEPLHGCGALSKALAALASSVFDEKQFKELLRAVLKDYKICRSSYKEKIKDMYTKST